MQNFLTKVFESTNAGLVLRQEPPFQHMSSSGAHLMYNGSSVFLKNIFSSTGAGVDVVVVVDGRETILVKAYEAYKK